MKAYYFVGRLLRPFGLLGLLAFSIVTRTPRVRVLVYDEQGQILLVQSWLSGNTWGIPGGGVMRGEKERVAAARELYEETGISVDAGVLRPLGTFRSFGHNEVVFTTMIRSSDMPARRGSAFEIKDIAWYSPGAVPRLEPVAMRVITELAANRNSATI